MSHKLSIRLNPIWQQALLEYGQSRRLALGLGALTILVTLVMCLIGALASASSEPSSAGMLLFHVFFGIAFAWVTWVGAGIAATAIASERLSGTLAAHLARGMTPQAIARGSFAASLTHTLLYLAMLSPIASLCFLFGGVSPSEVLWSFVAATSAACLAVGFGLALGARVRHPSTAILLAVPLAALASMVFYALGFVSSHWAEQYWSVVTAGTALWWPAALAHAGFNRHYWVALVGGPLLLMALCCWFLYELSSANLTPPDRDRSSRLRYWFIATSVVVWGTTLGSTLSAPQISSALTLVVVGGCSLFGMFLFAGDALEPSPRIRAQWAAQHASVLRRFLGPSVVRAMLLVCLLAAVALVSQGLMVSALQPRRPPQSAPLSVGLLVASYAYELAFIVFLAGFVAHSRARSNSGLAPRVLLTLVLLTLTLGPWLLSGTLAMTGLFTTESTLIVAAPSPAYMIAIQLAANDDGTVPRALLAAGLAASGCWLGLGLALLVAAARSVRKSTQPTAQPAP